MAKSKKKNKGVSKPLTVIAMATFFVMGATGIVQAQLQVDGTEVINPPAQLTVSGTTNTEQQAFIERQKVTLDGDLDCSEGAAATGDVVNSYMIFFNDDLTSPPTDTKNWEFDEEILCVMYEHSGIKQVATDNDLGAVNTSYSGIQNAGRGLELSGDSQDSITVNDTSIDLTMQDEGFGDWIRVVTRYVAPPDETAPVVFCEPINKNDKGNGPDKTFTLTGADEVDEVVELFLTDETGSIEFGPYAPGTTIRHSLAKGATPTANLTGNKEIDYAVKTQDTMYITATDEAGNTAKEVCNG